MRSSRLSGGRWTALTPRLSAYQSRTNQAVPHKAVLACLAVGCPASRAVPHKVGPSSVSSRARYHLALSQGRGLVGRLHPCRSHDPVVKPCPLGQGSSLGSRSVWPSETALGSQAPVLLAYWSRSGSLPVRELPLCALASLDRPSWSPSTHDDRPCAPSTTGLSLRPGRAALPPCLQGRGRVRSGLPPLGKLPEAATSSPEGTERGLVSCVGDRRASQTRRRRCRPRRRPPPESGRRDPSDTPPGALEGAPDEGGVYTTPGSLSSRFLVSTSPYPTRR